MNSNNYHKILRTWNSKGHFGCKGIGKQLKTRVLRHRIKQIDQR